MLKRLFLLFGMIAGLLAVATSPAIAEPDAEGATLDEVEGALRAGLDVTRAQTERGTPFLMVSGRNHTIAAHMVHCGSSPRCEGVRYFAILERKPSATLINAFNNKFHYSKISIEQDGDVLIVVEHHLLGGVASRNLLTNALILMLRMTNLNEVMDKVASAGGQFPQLADGGGKAALAQHSFIGLRPTRSGAPVDPALFSAFKANVVAD